MSMLMTSPPLRNIMWTGMGMLYPKAALFKRDKQ